MKRRLGFLPFLIFIYASGFSQSLLDPVQPRADIIAHSPEAEAMTKYGVLPLTLYTGLPQISVPVFQINVSGLSLPFSLSFNYNGFKPTETASWCGFGWSFQGAGSISKIIKGQIDGTRGTGKNYDDFISVDALAWNQPFLTNIVNGVIDSEPDIYIFNVGAYSGKFVMIKGQAYLFPFQNLKITSTGTGFKLVDDKGNIYLFNDIETTFTKNSDIPNHTSAWQLSQIITADKKDTVKYTYQSYSFKQPSTYTDRYAIDTHLVAGNNNSGQTFSRNYVDGDHITSLALSSITSRYANLSFVGSATDRLDMPGSTGGKVLDKIVISKPDGTLQKEFVLVHDYYGNNSKLKLKETFERQYTNGDLSKPVIKQHHLFEYQQETSDLSLLQTQYGTDYWGYYNGANNQMLFDQNSLSLNYVVMPYGNRTANASASSAGTIKKITYPTGGYTTFEFEQNQKGTSYLTSSYTNSTLTVSSTYAANNQQNGITEKHSSFTLNKGQMVKVVYGDGDDFNTPTVPVLRIYSGLPLSTNTPIFTSKLYSDQIEIHNDSVYLNAGHYYLSVVCESGIVGSDLSYGTYGTVNYKTYTAVNTLADAPGLRVKKISSYDGISASPAIVKQYTYTNGVELTRGAYSGNNLNHYYSGYYEISYFASSRSALSDLAETQFYYGQVTESTQDATKTGQTVYTYDTQSSQLLDVKLTSQTDYKYVYPDYVPVKKTTNSYTLITRNNFNGFKVYKSMVDGNPALASPDATQASYLNQIYSVDPSEVYALISDNSLLQTTKEYVYGATGVDTVDNRTDYYYDNANHIYPTRIVTTKNNGDQITQTLKYPLDYNFNSCVLPDAINTNFKNDLATASNTMFTNYGNLLIALTPYQPYYPNTSSKQSSFATIANQYNLQADLQNGVTTAIVNRTTAFTAYATCLNNTVSNNTTPWQQSVAWMQLNNIVSPVIEKYISIKKLDGNEYILGATRNEYAIFNSLSAVEPVSIKQTEISTNLLKSTFLANPDTYYKPQLTFSYDQDLSVVSQQKNNDAVTTYLYGYKQVYPLAEIKNASFSQVLTALGLTAAQYKAESYAKTPSASYLSKINALRQNLPTAMITTYVQNPLVGILSASDPNNITSYYEYDALGRLIDIKDNNGKILKAFEYHYQQ
ncbi:MAG TPA: hypothetical protein VIM65_03455 [Cyclobacteriaceae bacterium]